MTSCLSSSQGTWEGDLPACPLKVAVIREELVALTGDPLMAVVLNQLLYWTQRVKDFDLLLEEEKEINSDCTVAPRHGWIYKTAEDLGEETMLRVSRHTIRRYLTFLKKKGWVDERINPQSRWNKTTQYRVNLKKVQGDLLTLGYSLPGFSVGEVFLKTPPLKAQKTAETPNDQNAPSRDQNARSNGQKCSFIYLNRDYTETINRDHTQSACESSKQMIEVWKKHVGQEVLHLTPERKRQLKPLLSRYFKNDFQEWEKFCERIKATPFLMGEGLNKWHVTFDWILSKGNILKVLEGNFDSSERIQHKQKETLQSSREQEKQAILTSIQDPLWKEWCGQLSESNQISLFELQELSCAKFGEFDGRLVWVRSADQKTLNRIESVRLKLLSLVQRKFPTARNIRTEIEEEDLEETFSSDVSETSMRDLGAITHTNALPKFALSLPPPSCKAFFKAPLKTGSLYAE